LSGLVDRLAEEMSQRWHSGERPTVEDYLARYPDLGDRPEAAAELIYEELCLQEELGEGAAAEDVLRRFPQWRRQLQLVLDCHALLGVGGDRPRFPAVGASLGDFRLLAELGRGAQGRVFLATQPALADRPVVLKVTPCSGREHLSLARLQHSHIVPLYSAQDDPARNLRALCMPYFGGATLLRVLELLQDHPPSRRAGRLVLDALQRAQRSAPVSVPVAGPACQFLSLTTYVRAVCWMGACLADALQYAHERGLLHLDLKPSNVLWAADGQPMLLDLHLARGPIAAGAPPPEWLGGTPAYMAPEHRAALAAVSAGQVVPLAVDGRADLYALGLVLYEALGGAIPLPSRAPTAWLRHHNPEVTVGLADILGRCLAEDPRERYPDVAAVAADLRRHLADLPLRGVVNRSPAERWRKWRRRRPHAPTLFALVLSVLAAVGVVWIYGSQQAEKARSALAEGREHFQNERYNEARAAWQRGLAVAEDLPFYEELSEELRDQLRQTEAVEAARELHLFVERVRDLDGTDIPPAEARDVEVRCRAIWQRRSLVVERLGPRLGPERAEVRTDLLDLAILWTNLRVRLAGTEVTAASHRDALAVLGDAEALFGPSCALSCERRAHAAALALADVGHPAAPPPRSAWDHLALGRARLRAGDWEAATAHFDRALALQPRAFWPQFFKGRCAYQRGRYEDAVLALTACVALAPERAWCYYNRGLAYDALGRPDRALPDYERALELDPALAAAAERRERLHLRQTAHVSPTSDR
jgi:serine/threonine protein kinase/tetratricopeptide (TPR) repeat protein